MTEKDLKSLKPDAFKILPAKSACEGCVFLDNDPERICKITRDLDLLDLAVDIDIHFGVDCYKNKIIYKLRKP